MSQQLCANCGYPRNTQHGCVWLTCWKGSDYGYYETPRQKRMRLRSEMAAIKKELRALDKRAAQEKKA